MVSSAGQPDPILSGIVERLIVGLRPDRMCRLQRLRVTMGLSHFLDVAPREAKPPRVLSSQVKV